MIPLFSRLPLFVVVLALTTSLQAQDCPCCTPEHRQFDFWLGHWQVYTTDSSGTEQLAGANRIVLLQDSCVLQENWQSARQGYSGTSYNFYDKTAKQWKQLWLDNQGNVLELKGGLEGEDMLLMSNEMTDQEGRRHINRIRWTPLPDGSVRQHWQVSYNGGQRWETVFDGEYRRE